MPSGFARFLFVSLLLVACDRKPESEVNPDAAADIPSATATPPAVLYLPEDYEQRAAAAPTPTVAPRRCPPDMVLVRESFCVDRYEISLVEKITSRDLSPHYPPTRRYTTLVFERFKQKPARAQGPLQVLLPFPEPPDFQLLTDFEPRAVSRENVLPAGYLSRYSAEQACTNAGKRLCTREEWVTACRGENNLPFPYGSSYEEGACNVHRKSHPARLLHGDASKNHLDPRLGLTQDFDGPLLRHTGRTTRCTSTWGDDALFDMVGNVDEWIDPPAGSFVGGFFSRGTTAGCSASIDLHGPDYLDYSLGGRCCRNADPVTP